eukprot:NODE_9363_length_344_cov_54.695502.p2 GENE.NODE_9363_length_344_cov_54.695502~~NODE_9363_length_344_cov_54.695502.p2  ORF type:complete len:58 (-),score=20.69 NODE_9363_length_344_cov_54.695502:153-326(-)
MGYLGLATLGAAASVHYTVTSRDFDRNRMYQGVRRDVERMRKKAEEGICEASVPEDE